MLLGVVLGASLFVYDLLPRVSRASVFRQIRLGMPRQEVAQIMGEADAWCETSPVTKALEDSCEFRDVWRGYTIRFGPDGRVRRKSYSFSPFRSRTLRALLVW